AQTTWPAPLQSGDGCARPKPATRATSSCSPVREHHDSIPEGAGPAGQPSHPFTVGMFALRHPSNGTVVTVALWRRTRRTRRRRLSISSATLRRGSIEKPRASLLNDKDDPGLSAINNQRRKYARILWEISAYFHAIGHDKLPELGTDIGGLGVALEDLIRGVTDPLFVTKGSKRDSARIWRARLQAALGLECLILSALSRQH